MWNKGTAAKGTTRKGFLGQDQVDQRVEHHANLYGRTHVVLSFGARGGGAMFAQWLRQQLMQAKGYTQPNNVYLDTVALRDVPGTKLEMRNTHWKGERGVERDFNVARSQGLLATSGGLASLNASWHDYYKYAMRQAHTMIFALTADWFRSAYCARELNNYIAENEARRRDGRRALAGIVLRFDEPGCGGLAFPGMCEIPAKKQYVVNDQRRAKLTGSYADFWIIDSVAWYRLLASVTMLGSLSR